MKMFEEYNIDLTGKNVVIIGRSNIVGKPLIQCCLNKNATVTVCHSKTKDLVEYTKRADIVIVAIGNAKFLKADMVKENAVIIDIGINRQEDGKLCGDVDFENVEPKCYAITPVPKGVGAMTVAMLMENIVEQIEAGESEVVNE
jgi:methylenetetrahydrofolate dehydrogenase (NADP+)/methenyltetrahydrofolate cyclohydrolase